MFTQQKRKNNSLRIFLSVIMSLFLALGLVGVVAIPASAGSSNYTVEISAPESVGVGDGFTYTVTIGSEPVLKGAVLTTKLAEGVVFESVPTGGDSPVASYEYDPITRIVSFTLKDLEKPLKSFVFSVTQDQNEAKDESTVFGVEIEGSATPEGKVPSDTATTKVTGNWGYFATKSFSTVVGSGNREVTYYFNLGGPGQGTNTFSTWAQRLTDVLPAGVEIRANSAAPGEWVMSQNPNGSTTAVWERGEGYGPQAGQMVSETGVWISVYYPPSQFPDGQLPPRNEVDLEVKDNSGNWRTQTSGNAQVPELDQGSSKGIYLDKTVMGETETGSVRNGLWRSRYDIRASYQNSLDTEKLDQMVVTDQYAGNEAFFDHMETYRMAVRFNAVLQGQELPFSYEYTTNIRSSWQSFDTSSLTTGSDFLLTTQVAGSQNFENDEGFNQVLNLPAGERITGWRVTVGPGGAMIPDGSQVTVTPGFIASYPSLKDGAEAPSTPLVNKATVDGVLASGNRMNQAADEAAVEVVDEVPIITVITAPSAVETGGTAVYQAKVANLDPAGRSYQNSVMRVVLPPGVLYDPQVGISPAYGSTPTSGVVLPTIGAGLTVTTENLQADGVDRQVVIFTFDQLDSVRAWDLAKDRREWEDMFSYDIPVRVLPQAYDPTATQMTAESWAYTDDPVYSALEMGFANGYFAPDTNEFSAALQTIAKSSGTSRVVTAGGLLLGKTVSDPEKAEWVLSENVKSPGQAEWQIYVTNTLPDPFSALVIFDRLPALDDGRGSEFPVTVSGPAVASLPMTKIEYSRDAISADSGSWTEDPQGAIAIRFGLESLAAGESLTLVLPTSVPGNVPDGAVAINDVRATGSYNGTARDFTSNQARIVVDAPVEPVTPPTVEPPVTPPPVEPPVTVEPTVDPTDKPQPSENTASGELPNTGSTVAGLAIVAGILLMGGLTALFLAKRRGQHS